MSTTTDQKHKLLSWQALRQLLQQLQQARHRCAHVIGPVYSSIVVLAWGWCLHCGIFKVVPAKSQSWGKSALQSLQKQEVDI